MLLTAVLAAVAWGAVWHIGPTGLASQPVGYEWDGLYTLGVTKAYGDRGLSSLWNAPIHWLGAPYEAEWGDLPFEDVLFFSMGMVARVVGAVASVNLAYLMAAVLAAVAMFIAARRLRVARSLSVLLGLLFGLSPFLLFRGTWHLTVALYWPMPLWALIWAWASSRRGLKVGEPAFWFAVVVAIITATMSPYYLNFLLQVLGLVGVVQLASRRWRAALASVLVAVAGASVFALTFLDNVLYARGHGPNTTAINRNVGETLLYGLRPLELLWPSNLHRFDLFAAAGAKYASSAPVVGEFPSNYLGVLPGLAFIALVVAGVGGSWWRAQRGAATRFFPIVVWLIFVSMGGGLMQALQMIVNRVAFRSNNRVSIVLAGLALLYAGRLLTRWWSRVERRAPAQAWALAAGLALFGVWEQAPDLSKRNVDVGGMRATGRDYWKGREQWVQRAASDEKLVAALEAALPEDTAVFQLPVYNFPETGQVGGLGDYEPFRLYVHSHRKLRFNYGNVKGRPEANWQRQIAGEPPDAMMRDLAAKGFGAIVFDQRVFPPETAQRAIDTFSQGAPERVLRAEAGDLVAILLPR